MNGRAFSLFFLLIPFSAFPACSCGDDVKLTIVSPEDGADFDLAADVDAMLDGVQLAVVVATDGLDLGAQVEVSVTELDGSEIMSESFSVGAGGVVEAVVTLVDGENVIRANAEGASSSVTVTLDESSSSCPDISLVDPTEGAVLNGEDDSDEEPCGEFHYTVRVATNAQAGRGATLLIGDNEVASAQVEGAAVVFEDVTLDLGMNAIEVRLDGAGDCWAAASVTVDCGLTCTIAEPTGTALAIANDTSDEPGLQVDFVIGSDAEDGQEVHLIIDDDPSATATLAGGSATFSEVSLAEGERETQAECRDAAGNVGRSARARFTVDTVPPDVSITEPRGDTTFNIQDDDEDPDRDGLQIQVCATSDSENEVCAAVQGADPGPDGCANPTDGQACVLVDCNGQGLGLEATTQDDVGNVGSATVTVNCDGGVPVILIDEPQAGDILNAATDSDGVAPGLQATVVVCTDAPPPASVHLSANDQPAAEVEVVAEDCTAGDNGPTLDHTARFVGVTLPEGTVTLVASVSSPGGNDAFAPGVTVSVDSVEPRFTFTSPLCGVTVVDTDADLGRAGLQFDVSGSLGAGSSVVDGTVTWPSGEGEALPPPSVFGFFATFDNVTFRSGVNALALNLIDTAGNTGTATCDVQANEGGRITIDAPAGGTAFPYSGDPDHGTAGYQGATVSITSDGPTDGTMSVCVQDAGGLLIPNPVCVPYRGPGQVVTLTLPEGTAVDSSYDLVATTDNIPGGIELVSARVRVRVDTLPPTSPIGLTATVTDVRAGTVRLDFTAPADPNNRAVASYQVRQSATQFAGENDGVLVAPQLPIVISAPGAPQVLTITGLGPAADYYFAVRATDLIGNQGTSGTTQQPAELDLTIDTIDSPTALSDHLFGYTLAAGGDVNDDGFDDVVVGTFDFTNANEQRVYVLQGGLNGLSSTPLATIGPSNTGLGPGVALLRNFNGDDAFADVAVGDYAAEAVYVYDGGPGLAGSRSLAQASVVISGPAGEFSAFTLAAVGDLNDDGFSDLAIVGYLSNGGAGAVYVVYGAAALPAALTLPGDADAVINGVFGAAAPLAIVAPAGDVNADGVDDMILGACGGTGQGSAYVVYGAADLSGAQDADADLELPPPGGAADRGFGCSVGGVGDVDDNGIGDMVVGARDYTADARGAFYLFLPDGLGGRSSLLFTNAGGPNPENDYLAYAVAATMGTEGRAMPSFDSGEVPDVAVGQYRGPTETGLVNLFWGKAAFVAGDVELTADRRVYEPAGSRQLDSLSWAGDVDGDGWVDLVAGDNGALVAGVRAGRIYVVR